MACVCWKYKLFGPVWKEKLNKDLNNWSSYVLTILKIAVADSLVFIQLTSFIDAFCSTGKGLSEQEGNSLAVFVKSLL